MADAILDIEQLLSSCDGDSELAGEVASMFLLDIPNQFRDLEAAIARGDAGDAERIAHSIKGAAATFGGKRMRDTALACENYGREGRLAELADSLPELRRQFELVKAALADAGYGEG